MEYKIDGELGYRQLTAGASEHNRKTYLLSQLGVIGGLISDGHIRARLKACAVAGAMLAALKTTALDAGCVLVTCADSIYRTVLNDPTQQAALSAIDAAIEAVSAWEPPLPEPPQPFNPDDLHEATGYTGEFRGECGDLHVYATGDYVRTATAAETKASIAAAEFDGGAGTIDVDGVAHYVVGGCYGDGCTGAGCAASECPSLAANAAFDADYCAGGDG